MSRDQLGLPSFMLAFAKSFIRVVPPNPTGDLYTLPTLSEESLLQYGRRCFIES